MMRRSPQLMLPCERWWLGEYPRQCQCQQVRAVLVVSHRADDRSYPATLAALTKS